jgi:hypothetical protein
MLCVTSSKENTFLSYTVSGMKNGLRPGILVIRDQNTSFHPDLP